MSSSGWGHFKTVNGVCPGACDIPWATTPGTHTFAAEIDGLNCRVASIGCISSPDTIYAESKGTFTVVAGATNIFTLALNGIAGGAGWVSDGQPNASAIHIDYEVVDPVGQIITAQTPSNFDNGPLTLYITGTLSSGSASITSGAMLAAPDILGDDYGLTVACSTAPPANGSFTINVGTGSSPNAITSGELLENGLRYSYSVGSIDPPATSESFPTYACTNGSISDTTSDDAELLRRPSQIGDRSRDI